MQYEKTLITFVLDPDNISGLRHQRIHPMDTTEGEHLPDDVTIIVAGCLEFHSKSDRFPAGVHVCVTPNNLYHWFCPRSA